MRPKSVRNFRNQRTLVQLLGLLIVLFLSSVGISLAADRNMLGLGNTIIPIALAITLSLAAYSLLRVRSALIWTPLPWFFLSCALYYGAGPLIYTWGNAESVSAVDRFFAVSQAGMMSTNVLNIVGIGMVVIGYLITNAVSRTKEAVAANRFDARQAKVAALTFLIIGVPIKYFLALPFLFGSLDFVLPGSIQSLQVLAPLAIVPLVALVGFGYSGWRFLLYPLVTIELLVSLMEFGKMSVLITLIMILLGVWFRKPNVRTLLIGFTILLCAYLIATPLVPYGRDQIVQLSGTHNHATISDRSDILMSYAQGAPSGADASSLGLQRWWTRINNANYEAYAMERYDHGRRGVTLDLALITLVPRLVWPNKPIISDVGAQFNYEMTGNANSMSAPGIFGEAYWNGGWLLVLLIGAYVGILFAVFSKYSLRHLCRQHFILLPIVFVGIRMGFRPDGWFVGEYLAAPAIALVLHFFLSPLIGLRFGTSPYKKNRQTSATPIIHVLAVRDDEKSSDSGNIK